MRPAEAHGEGVVRFGLFEANLASGELRRNGAKVRLQEQPFQILALLLRKPGEVVTREELRTNLWAADTFVDFDHGLNAAIKRLRDALGDSADNPRFVETLARRGYRFIAPVSARDYAAGPESDSVAVSSIAVPASALKPASASRTYAPVVAGIVAVLVVGLIAGFHVGRYSSASVRPVESRLTGNPQNEPVWSAALSPDGKYLAFSDKTGFFLRVVGSGETHVIAEPDGLKTHQIVWFPDGARILAIRGKWPGKKPSLWTASVLGGTPRELADEAEQAAISPDGQRIAYVRGDYNHQELWTMDADGQHPGQLIPSQGGELGAVAWSPDGKRVAYLHYIYRPAFDDGVVTLNVCDPVTRTTSTMINNPRLYNSLAWAPDFRLIYSVGEPMPNRSDSNLWAQKIDARSYKPVGEPFRLTAGPDAKVRSNISGDGKRLAYLRVVHTPSIFISSLRTERSEVTAPQRLSLDERANYPYDWTPDSKTLIFTSDRDGVFHLFRQGLDQPAPELLVGGNESVTMARINPAGTHAMYLLLAPPSDLEGRVRMMKVPLSGGVPQQILAEKDINNFQCARRISKMCVFSQFHDEQLVFYRFDPDTGQETLLKTIADPEWYLQNWTLSPDGTALALAKKHRGPSSADIRLERLDGSGAARVLTLENWSAISYIDWAADSKGFWVSAADAEGVQALLHVDLRGHVTSALREPEMDLGWAIPAPDGKHVAIWKAAVTSNAWMVEGF